MSCSSLTGRRAEMLAAILLGLLSAVRAAVPDHLMRHEDWERQLQGLPGIGGPTSLENPSLLAAYNSVPLPENINETCRELVQLVGLSILWESTGGPHWNDSSGWLRDSMPVNVSNLSVDLDNTCLGRDIYGQPIYLPQYCCWNGVTCCTNIQCNNSVQRWQCDCSYVGMVTMLQLPSNNLTGLLPDNWLNWIACDLKLVDFAFNSLTGSINSNVSKIEKLQALGLSYNNFTGTLPPQLGQLQDLAVIDLTGNHLTGAVPVELCNGTTGANLTDILLAGNQFNGTFNITDCNNLIQLDITNNQFQGGIPDLAGYFSLHILRAGSNALSTQLSDGLSQALWMTDLDLSNNGIRGPIPSSITNMRLLAYLKLENNELTGTIPPGLFAKLGMLTRATLFNNNLTGTIPDISIQLRTIRLLDLSNNYLVGQIPDSFAVLANPGITVTLSNNWLSCCGIDVNVSGIYNASDISEVYGGVNWSLANDPNSLLPPYLAFSSFQIPVPDLKGVNYTNMRCPGIRKAGDDDTAAASLDWDIDPQYYLYYMCTCNQGYRLINVTRPDRLPVFRCQQINDPWYIRLPWVLPVSIVGAVLLLICALFLTMYRKGARPAFVQQYLNITKRLKGEPKEGMVTIVTTDIEAYSDLMKREPELMGKGLRIHNYCIDKARWQFFGFTLEQEGDSFIIAFYDPFDAVAFCLQSQLMLQRVEWPEKLLNQEGGMERARKSSMLSQALQGAARILMRENRDKQSQAASTPSAATATAPSPSALLGAGSDTVNGESQGLPAASAAAGSSGMGSRLLRGMLSRKGPSAIPEEHAVPTNSPSVTGSLAKIQEPSALKMSTGPTYSGSQPRVFNGLRVRMGIATGKLEKGTSLRSSAIMERSKVVSDAGAGGQVLMDDFTFRHIKERLVELGAVDHTGLSLSKINLSRPSLLSWLCGARRNDDQETAVVLDMGQYVHTSARPNPHSFLASSLAAPSFRSQTTQASTSQQGQSLSSMEQAANSAVSAVDDNPGSYIPSETQRLHLYQIVSPVLVERARHFGSKLALKETDWICVDPPYFSAPGAAESTLGLDNSAIIPAITMVFCMVDGAKDWKSFFHDRDRQSVVQRTIRDVLRNTLMCIKGGYLCRLQEDEFKYMAAFAEPEDAARWCLVVQDALMWQEWPEWLLRLDKAKEERDERGEILFRGPRLRMGMCHGCPRAIVPDHMGRADYHGASINSAARYMDAAAHGGQVVCEEETATAMVARWNRALKTVDSTCSSTSRLNVTSRSANLAPYSAPEPDLMLSSAPFNTSQPASPFTSAVGEASRAHAGSLPPIKTSGVGPSEVSFTTHGAGSSDTPTASRPASMAAMASETHLPISRFALLDNAPNRASAPGIRGPIDVSLPPPPQVRPSEPGHSTGSHSQSQTSCATQATLAMHPSSKPASAKSHDGASSVDSRLINTTTQYPGDSEGDGDDDAAVWRDNPMISGRTTPQTRPNSTHANSEAGTEPSPSCEVSPGSQGASEPVVVEQAGTAADPLQPHGHLPADTNTSHEPRAPGASSSEVDRSAHAEQCSPSKPVPVSASTPASPFAPHALSTSPPSSPSAATLQPQPSSLSSATTLPLDPASASSSFRPTPTHATHTSARRTFTPQGILKMPSALQTSDSQTDLDPPDRLSNSLIRPGPQSAQPATHRRSKASVRIQLPEPDRASPLRLTQPLPSIADRPSSTSTVNANQTTYRAAVSVVRLGGFVFKGSDDIIPMVCLLLDSYGGRQFPSEPPKGKGNRVSVASGVLATAPVVELPSIGRRCFWAWRTLHQEVAQTPRGTSGARGWASLAGLTSRNSRNSNGTNISDAPASSHSTPGHMQQGRVTLPGMLGRSKNLLMAVMQLRASRNARHPAPRTSEMGQLTSEQSGILYDRLSVPVPGYRPSQAGDGDNPPVARVPAKPPPGPATISLPVSHGQRDLHPHSRGPPPGQDTALRHQPDLPTAGSVDIV